MWRGIVSQIGPTNTMIPTKLNIRVLMSNNTEAIVHHK